MTPLQIYRCKVCGQQMTEYDHCLLGCACKGWGNEPEVDFGTFDEDRHELVAVEPVSAIPKDLEDRIRQDVHDWYAPRIERIKDLAKEAGIWEKVACALANSGSSEIGEPPEYALRLNMLKAERDAERAKLAEVRESVNKAIETIAGPLGRARGSLALKGVSRAEQKRDLDLIANGMKELRSTILSEKSNEP